MKRLVCLLAVACSIAPTSFASPTPGFAPISQTAIKKTVSLDSYDIKTLYDLGAPTYSAGTSIFSEGTLEYASASSTVGYSLQNSNILLESGIEFTNAFAWPSWFSITMRASGFDRTLSGNLENKGYTFLIRPSGEVTFYKDGSKVDTYQAPVNFAVGNKRTIVYGAVNEADAVRVILTVDGEEVVNYLDETNPIIDEANRLTYCADGSVSAILTSKNTPVPEPLDDFPFDEHEIISLTDLSSPSIAGTGTYYEDGLIHYAHAGSTVGYKMPNPDAIMEFEVTFTNRFETPTWLSFNLRASGFDRTHAAALDCLGYVMLISPNGSVTLKKDRTAVAKGSGEPLQINTKYNFKVAAIEYKEGIRAALFINDVAYVDYYDRTGALLDSGSWFNICGDAGGKSLSADFLSTKESFIPPYDSYTFSNLGIYPLRAGTPRASVDPHTNAIEFSSSSQSVGFSAGLQNFSLGGYYYIQEIATFSNFWIALRATGFERATSSNVGGYSIRLSGTGAVEIYKKGGSNPGRIGSGSFSFAKETGYYIEFGAVDYNESKTMVFVAVNNRVIAQAFDEEEPIQSRGWVNMTPDGNFFPYVTSRLDFITLLRHKTIQEDGRTNHIIYMDSAFGDRDMRHEDFEERILKAIEINGEGVDLLNARYHGLDSNEERVNAVSLSSRANQLIVSIADTVYDEDGNVVDGFTPSTLTIRKTSGSRGFMTAKGFILKNTTVYEL
jgi:hypothetical protein